VFGAVTLVDGLVVVLAGEEEVVEDLKPAIGERAQRLVVRISGESARLFRRKVHTGFGPKCATVSE
jgi:hypothetical protein